MGLIFIELQGDLADLLLKKFKSKKRIELVYNRKASVKDVIESTGIPHTEVGRIIVNGSDADFHYVLREEENISVHPPEVPVDVTSPTLLLPQSFDEIAFIVDANVARLAGLLRMLGFDAFYADRLDDEAIASKAFREQRILLTKDKHLLKRKNVLHGHYVREIVPEEQVLEIIKFYGLSERMNPFSRCMACNGLLQKVDKEEIIHLLEPLTKKYYFEFQRCWICGRLFWAGSHRERMEHLVQKIKNNIYYKTRKHAEAHDTETSTEKIKPLP